MNNLKDNLQKKNIPIPNPIKIPIINFENIATPLVEKKAISDIKKFIQETEEMI